MRITDDPFISEIVDDYISLCTQYGYFDYVDGNEFRESLLNKNLVYDDTLGGDAKSTYDTLIVNRKNTYKNKRNASYILFHEFTHFCNDIHNDLFGGQQSPQLFRKLSNYMESHFDTHYAYGYENTHVGDVNNPYTYMLRGAVLLDEAIAEYVAVDLISKKYNSPANERVETRKLGNNYIHYKTQFDYYGISEKIADEFAKTLIMPNDRKNLKGLCQDAFRHKFVKNLMYQHCENKTTLECFYKELSDMGVVQFAEEQRNGHLREGNSPIPDYLVYTSYNDLFELLRYGYDDRELPPKGVEMPF